MSESRSKKKRSAASGEAPLALDELSLEDLRRYIAERESREGGAAAGVGASAATSPFVESRRAASAIAESPLSVRETLRGKKILVVGGTGFLGRVMLYLLFKYAPDMERIYLLIRPTHGRTGRDRLNHEILNSPVFTTLDGDAEMFRRLAEEKIIVVEGDAARPGLALKAEDREELKKNVDIVLNTAGNVEFNPPLDLSLNANTVATREVLSLVAEMDQRRYVHISTCYVADRQKYRDRAPEEIVSDRVITSSGNEVVIDAPREIEESLRAVADIKARYDRPETLDEYRRQAAQDLKRIGREDVSDRLIEKTAKNLRTMAARDELIRVGRERAERYNRPNVYTYTKTLAELTVKSFSDRVKWTIVRPSIVETSVRYPFPGWNEGIQGSAPLMYLIYKGHRMLPSLSDEPGERREAQLDIIPVDYVAATSVLAMCALLRDEAAPVYQAAAGPMDTPITPNRILNVLQTKLRERDGEDQTPLERFMTRNLQSYPVTKRAYQRFSSPRMLSFLTRARDRIENFDSRRLPPFGQDLYQRVQGNVERFYQLSLMKNRIFQEFMPFMNHGYPVFENQNGINLWRRLPAEESKIFYFNPPALDSIEYLADYHIDAVFRWIFPVLDKRFKSILQIGKRSGDRNGSGFTETLRAAFAQDDLEFRDRLHLLRRTALKSLREARERQRKRAETETTVSPESQSWAADHLTRFNDNRTAKKFAELAPEALARFADHAGFISGESITPEMLLELATPQKLQKRLLQWQEELGRNRKRGPLHLPEEGVELPGWIQRPTADFLYQLQMWFYRRVLNAKISGRDHIPLNNNHVVVIANHASHLDYGLVWYALGEYGRDMGILAARDYFFDRFVKSTFFGNFLNLIPIERGETQSYARALKNGMDFLNRGGPLLIFPEGTRSQDGKMQTFRHGLGYLVAQTRADVLPMRLYNTHVALPKGKTVVMRSADVRVEIGKVIPYEELEAETRGFSPTKTYAHISRRLEEAVRRIHR